MNDLHQLIDDIVFECVGDYDLREYDDYKNMNLYDEYQLDVLYEGIEILAQIKERTGIEIPPHEVKRSEMNTINDIIRLVERYQ